MGQFIQTGITRAFINRLEFVPPEAIPLYSSRIHELYSYICFEHFLWGYNFAVELLKPPLRNSPLYFNRTTLTPGVSQSMGL
jgi:hypothetical protein